ncbi:MAG TPA: YiiD C-terminal domain-containing protein [Candidatus Competibacteraceae bacterium]|nr:YiiD C-terminal domain-containing protein [Candidatus Competibacteraceae bacterium]
MPIAADLDSFLARNIPLTQAMGIRLLHHDARGLALAAPLAPNVNDKGTAFAGALATLVTLAGWALTQLTLEAHGETAQVVVADSQLHYLRPVRGEIVAACALPPAEAVVDFLQTYRRRGRARWLLHAEILEQGHPALRYSGHYVAYRG